MYDEELTDCKNRFIYSNVFDDGYDCCMNDIVKAFRQNGEAGIADLISNYFEKTILN